jgi:hypothetical protein
MPQINTPASGHVGPTPLPGGYEYLPYTNSKHLATLRAAINTINHRINGHARCDAAFKALPGGRTFAQIWGDMSVWINFDPSQAVGSYGATRGKNITITAYALAQGHWTTAATLVHELAHVNGAPGTTHQAEGVLRHCLLANLENPSIIGQLLGPANAGCA